MLEIDGLIAQVGHFRLGEVSLAVAPGSCHAVVGPSGSGKSTLLGAILGTLPVLRGYIRLAGEDLTALPIERRQIGYVPQQLGLFPHLSVRANLLYSARARRVPEPVYGPLLARLLEITGIGGLLDRRIQTLSGGERQRVALVRALVAKPRLVLLDEPFSALNESLRRELWWLVKELQQEQGLTVMLVTHDLTEAYSLADQITVLIDGRQEQSGDKAAIYRRPASLAVARFLGLKNLFPARAQTPGLLDCPAFGVQLRIKDSKVEGEELWVGIRAEHVAVRRPNDPLRPDETRLSGYFERILDLGDSAMLHLRTPSGALLEIRCRHRLLRSYAIQEGKMGIVGLPADELFVIRS